MATTKNRISISLSDMILEELKQMTESDGLTKSSLITILIMDEYARRRKQQKEKKND